MSALLVFAFLSGVITILSPCILPVLPIVLAGSVGRGKSRPLGVIAGFILSFTLFTLALTAIVDAIGIPSNALRIAAVVLIVGFGIVMLVPRLSVGFELLASRITSRKSRPGKRGNGFVAGIPVGMSLGLVWTPCVGPIMASVISLALTQRLDGGAVLITIAYSLGTSIPMFAIMIGGRTLLNRVPALAKRTAGIRRGFGVAMILVGLAIGLGWDQRFQTAVLTLFPNYGTGLTAIENGDSVRDALDNRFSADLDPGAPVMVSTTDVAYDSLDTPPSNGKLGDYGPAPELIAGGEWFNRAGLGVPERDGAPVRMADLLGKVVLVDFWTYSCVNCVRTIPHLEAWYEEFRDQGFVVLGVHTPEFEFEKRPANVLRAIRDLGITYPVVQDNSYAQWRAYRNRYWPAHYFIDADGHIRYFYFGEGEYDTAEKVIRALLREAGAKNVSARARIKKSEVKIESRTAETYLGYGRAEGFVSLESPIADVVAEYTASGEPGNGEWSLQGSWIVTREYIAPEDSGVLTLGFNAKNVFLVIEPFGDEGRIDVRVDGESERTILPEESRLYQLVGFEEPGEHVLSLEIHGKLRLFAFTFG